MKIQFSYVCKAEMCLLHKTIRENVLMRRYGEKGGLPLFASFITIYYMHINATSQSPSHVC